MDICKLIQLYKKTFLLIQIFNIYQRWKCSNLPNNFAFCLLNESYCLTSKCGYKDENNQLALIECDKPILNSYVCQKSINYINFCYLFELTYSISFQTQGLNQLVINQRVNQKFIQLSKSNLLILIILQRLSRILSSWLP